MKLLENDRNEGNQDLNEHMRKIEDLATVKIEDNAEVTIGEGAEVSEGSTAYTRSRASLDRWIIFVRCTS